MDRTEAIEHLKDIITNKISIHGGNEEAISMAISALEQAPTFKWLMQKADEWGMAYGKQFLIEAQRAWKGDKDINVLSKSALDHIHNVVRDDAYRRGYDAGYEKGYEQGKKDVIKWIPVNEQLPKKDSRYLVTRYDYVTNTEFIDILWYEKNIWWNGHSTGDYVVTAWIPIPEPYKEE